jgi:HEAT repeat protein
MLTYYCPNCWTIVEEDQQVCPNCGFVLDQFEKQTFEDKLLAALHHTVPERRIMAAQILGNRGSQRAVPEFRKIIEGDEEDYFFLRAVLLAVSKIDHPDRDGILQTAVHHTSDLIRHLTEELIAQRKQNNPSDRWDRHTG